MSGELDAIVCATAPTNFCEKPKQCAYPEDARNGICAAGIFLPDWNAIDSVAYRYWDRPKNPH